MKPPSSCPASIRPTTKLSRAASFPAPRPTARNRASRSRSSKKDFRLRQPQSGQPELQADIQAAETVFHAAPEIDGRRFLEVFRRAAHLADRKTVPEDLCCLLYTSP